MHLHLWLISVNLVCNTYTFRLNAVKSIYLYNSQDDNSRSTDKHLANLSLDKDLGSYLVHAYKTVFACQV